MGGGVVRTYEPVEGVTVWIDGGIHIKTRDPHDDPIEMNEVEALALAALLQRLASELKATP
ncbi:MAG: hypothetical protein C0494_17820 [Sphingobium sp.]|nr:hypothetical protein [Sphingobium sp.]